MAAEQSYGNHARFSPFFHFFAFPILAINLVVTIVWLVKAPGLAAAWAALVAAALVALAYTARMMILRVQDRVIRQEERLRLAKLLPAELEPRIEQLTLRQIVGLRFASDAEVPELCKKVLDGTLEGEKELKQAVRSWRADHLRA